MKTSNRQCTSFILPRLLMFLLTCVGMGLTLMSPCAGATFQFQRTGNLLMGRDRYTATLLQNGQLLAVGSG